MPHSYIIRMLAKVFENNSVKQTLGMLSEHIAYPDPTVVSGTTTKGHSQGWTDIQTSDGGDDL